jgi:DNA end-binding protein Ku
MASTVWKGHIAFGMVSFPVKLHAAARSQTVSFHLLHKCDHSRVKQVLYCQAEDHPVSRSELVKGFEYDKDRYVVIEEHDLTRAEPRTARLMEVLQFVPAAQVDPVYLDTSYYVVPEAAGQRPYTLLFYALKQSGHVAMAQWTAHNREHMVLLRPGRHGLILHTLYYQDEVRAEDEFHIDSAQIPARELELARLLIDALAAGFEPTQYRDRYRENLRALIEAKIQGQEIADGVAEPVRPPVLDIVRALETSLARAQKPVSVVNGGGASPVDADTEICRRPRKRA